MDRDRGTGIMSRSIRCGRPGSRGRAQARGQAISHASLAPASRAGGLSHWHGACKTVTLRLSRPGRTLDSDRLARYGSGCALPQKVC